MFCGLKKQQKRQVGKDKQAQTFLSAVRLKLGNGGKAAAAGKGAQGLGFSPGGSILI